MKVRTQEEKTFLLTANDLISLLMEGDKLPGDLHIGSGTAKKGQPRVIEAAVAIGDDGPQRVIVLKVVIVNGEP